MDNKKYKSGFVAIIGNPSVGKSTLLNKLIGEKIAITSPKPQTTRRAIKGIITTEEYQIIFIDTPGVNKTRNKLGKLMDKSINESVRDADLVIAMIDAVKDNNEEEFLGKLNKVGVPTILLINKTDSVKDKQNILKLIEKYNNLYSFEEIIPISARRGEGLESLKSEIVKRLPYGPKYFSEDTLTDIPVKVIISDIIREKSLMLLKEEVPHGIAVDVDKFKRVEDTNFTDIEATIYCERESHKGIIIGRAGAMLSDITKKSKADIEKLLDEKISLRIWVKVKKGWKDSEIELRRLNILE